MRKSLLALNVLFLFVLVSSAFAQTCRVDWDCRNLEQVVELDHNVCTGQVYVYDATWGQYADTLFKQPNWVQVVPPLAGKRYTKTIQTGYRLKYGCVEGVCDVVKREAIEVGCRYGCLVTPTKYNGRTWSNFCVCVPGSLTDRPIVCGEGENNRFAYEVSVDWTCEVTRQLVGICPIGQRCVEKPDEVTCEDIPGSGPIQYPDGKIYPYEDSEKVEYAMLLPRYLNRPIEVVAMQNGRVIAKRPISDLSAEQYIAKYGPVRFDQAHAFAQKLGLTAYASRNNSFETGTTTASTRTSSYIARASYLTNSAVKPITPTTSTYKYYKPSYSYASTSPYSKTYYRSTYSYTPKTTISRMPSTRTTTRKTYSYKTPTTKNTRYFTKKTSTPTTRYYSRNTFTPRTTTTNYYYYKRYITPTRTRTKKTRTARYSTYYKRIV